MKNLNHDQPSVTIDVLGAARAGFEAIRWCLQRGEVEIAADIAEALHNLPERGNAFQLSITLKSLAMLLLKYPEHPVVARLNQFIM